MLAINRVVENNGDFIGAFRENVIRVIGKYSTKNIHTKYDDKIEFLQEKMLSLIEENAKQGAVAEDFDGEYKRISEEINELKEAKLRLVQEKKQTNRYKEKLTELDTTLKTLQPQVREFDEELVRRLIKTIKVNKGERLEIQFGSGIVMEQVVNYYN
ncbi:Site-specific recombinase [Wansuia hejianensis]|uniref:Site-specific recombinase n=1 Tax=Wansuia hejianensis TaxID=2763667 RepID=UPI0020162DCF|nr:Site-specific recombinase [Wansuia hejianensis]